MPGLSFDVISSCSCWAAAPVAVSGRADHQRPTFSTFCLLTLLVFREKPGFVPHIPHGLTKRASHVNELSCSRTVGLGFILGALPWTFMPGSTPVPAVRSPASSAPQHSVSCVKLPSWIHFRAPHCHIVIKHNGVGNICLCLRVRLQPDVCVLNLM